MRDIIASWRGAAVLALWAAACSTYDSQARPMPGYTLEVVATDILRVDGVGIGPSGAILATEEYLGGGVVRIDPVSGAARHVVRDLANPDNIVVRPTGDIYLTEEYLPGRIVHIDPQGRVRTFASGLRKPEGLDVDAEGHLYVTEHQPDGRLIRYQADGSSELLLDGVVNGEGLRVLADGSVLIAETSAGRILRVFPDGSTQRLAEGELDSPDGVGYDPATGRVFVTEDAAPGRLLELDPDSGALTEIVTGLNLPQTMTFEPGGAMLLSEQGEDRILRVRTEVSP